MARIAVDVIDTEGLGTVAGVTLTLVYVLGAVETCEAIWAVAGKLISPRLAGTIGARCQDTGII